jgi:hypothetical protein
MNCKWAKPNLTLYLYRELPDDLHYELEQHVGRCADCAAELHALQQFHVAMSQVEEPEITPNLLAASRIGLSASLEAAEQIRGWRLLDPVSWLKQMKFSPALASALLIAGFALGAGTAWRIAAAPVLQPAQQAPVAAMSVLGPAPVANIRSISQQPNSNQVEITYETLIPQKLEGSLQDQRIQQLLLLAARNNTNSGVRMDSVDLLIQNPDDARIREALKSALLYDSNPGVRLRALDALGPFVKQDVSVRDSVLEALQSDNNPGVRALAIRLLQPVRVDSTVRGLLQRLSREDQSPFIREQSKDMLATLPEID